MARARMVVEKPGRDAYWEALARVMGALMDDPDSGVSYANVHLVQHANDASQFYGYVELRCGELDQGRYDHIRKLVNDAGGEVNVADPDGDYNLRVWPIAKEA